MYRLTSLARLSTLILMGISAAARLGHGQPIFTPIVQGLSRPVHVAEAPDGSQRLVISEQGGAIKVHRNGAVLTKPYLNISSRLAKGYEQGLLGFAFDPRFRSTRRVFIHYTRRDGASVISSLTERKRNRDRLDIRSEKIRLVIPRPTIIHNGGYLEFGPDRLLYISSGDGGPGGDPLGNAQNLTRLLGKILRIDVRGAHGYKIPSSNPFARSAKARPEIFAYGLRNPWRFSFDKSTRRLFAGDVGQDRVEEINIISRGGNYGWNRKEGLECYPAETACTTDYTVPPIATYGRDLGQSVTGGIVYRGSDFPTLQGTYFFGDFSSGRIFSMRQLADQSWLLATVLESEFTISSFAQTLRGELLLVDYRGEVLQLTGWNG